MLHSFVWNNIQRSCYFSEFHKFHNNFLELFSLIFWTVVKLRSRMKPRVTYYEHSDSYFIDLHDSFLWYNVRLLGKSPTSRLSESMDSYQDLIIAMNQLFVSFRFSSKCSRSCLFPICKLIILWHNPLTPHLIIFFLTGLWWSTCKL